MGIAAYGLYGLRNRKTSMSLYLIQLRVAAQGFAVGTLAIGLCYTVGKRFYHMYQGVEEEYNPKAGR